MKYTTFKSSVDSEGQMMCLSKGHTIPGRETQQGEEHGGRPRRADGPETALERTLKKSITTATGPLTAMKRLIN